MIFRGALDNISPQTLESSFASIFTALKMRFLITNNSSGLLLPLSSRIRRLTRADTSEHRHTLAAVTLSPSTHKLLKNYQKAPLISNANKAQVPLGYNLCKDMHETISERSLQALHHPSRLLLHISRSQWADTAQTVVINDSYPVSKACVTFLLTELRLRML